jgi:hypothetical protein
MLLAVAMMLSVGGAKQAWAAGVSASMYDCGTWAMDRETGRPTTWYLSGLLDGLALGMGVEIWGTGSSKITPEQAALWMDKYCRENPLSGVIRGAYVLKDERARKNH